MRSREVVGTEEFGGGGVIDFVTEDGIGSTAAVILDADGRFHVAFVDGYLGGEASAPAAPTDGMGRGGAGDARRAGAGRLRCVHPDRSPSVRPGLLPDEADTCAFVEASSVPSTSQAATQRQKLKSLGANADYAFYGLETPRRRT